LFALLVTAPGIPSMYAGQLQPDLDLRIQSVMAQELNNLAALRRISMDVNELRVYFRACLDMLKRIFVCVVTVRLLKRYQDVKKSGP
jgi:hypothetical protein